METSLRTPVTRGFFISSLTELRRQPSVSIRKKYPLEPRVTFDVCQQRFVTVSSSPVSGLPHWIPGFLGFPAMLIVWRSF